MLNRYLPGNFRRGVMFYGDHSAVTHIHYDTIDTFSEKIMYGY